MISNNWSETGLVPVSKMNQLQQTFLEARGECQDHHREMCRIVIVEDFSVEVKLDKLRDSILKFKAREPRNITGTQDFPKTRTKLD